MQLQRSFRIKIVTVNLKQVFAQLDALLGQRRPQHGHMQSDELFTANALISSTVINQSFIVTFVFKTDRNTLQLGLANHSRSGKCRDITQINNRFAATHVVPAGFTFDGKVFRDTIPAITHSDAAIQLTVTQFLEHRQRISRG